MKIVVQDETVQLPVMYVHK